MGRMAEAGKCAHMFTTGIKRSEQRSRAGQNHWLEICLSRQECFGEDTSGSLTGKKLRPDYAHKHGMKP